MNIGDTVQLTVIDTNESGIGVARLEGAVVFVPSLVEGDTADITITEIKKNYATGKAVRNISYSDKRITPVCPAYEKCGGCTLAHVTYEYENEIKKKTVCAALRRAGLDFSFVGDTVFSPSRSSYRNKVTVHYDKRTHRLGLYSEESHEVVQFSGCSLLPDLFNEIITFLNQNCSVLDSIGAKEIVLKSSSESTLAIIKADKKIDKIKKILNEKFGNEVTVADFANAENEYIHGDYGDLKMRFSAVGFRQVNNEAFSSLLEVVSDAVGETVFSSCADLYCGSGVIGLYLAMKHPNARFYGIEINEKSIEDAKHNADANRIKNISFFCGDAASFREKMPPDERPETVVVDPPRAGLSDKMKKELVSLAPERIVYISCNPQTLARDLKSLAENEYDVISVTPVNMFPMTKHVETVVLLSRA